MSDTAARPSGPFWLDALRQRRQARAEAVTGPLPVRDYVNVTAQPSTVMGFDQALVWVVLALMALGW